MTATNFHLCAKCGQPTWYDFVVDPLGRMYCSLACLRLGPAQAQTKQARTKAEGQE